jgi:hypothetical protein
MLRPSGIQLAAVWFLGANAEGARTVAPQPRINSVGVTMSRR